CAPSYVPAESLAAFPYRLVDRAHAVPILVEHLVWTPALGRANPRILERREAPTPYSACACATRGAYDSSRPHGDPLVSGNVAPRAASRRGSAQHGCVGYGAGHLGR